MILSSSEESSIEKENKTKCLFVLKMPAEH